LIAVALMILWAEHDGGYDAETWYWGALALLGLTAGVTIKRGITRTRIPRLGGVTIAAFGLYVAWSYLSITWAQAPGTALEGSNRALLYLIVFALMLTLPWKPQGAQIALLAFALGVGVIGITILLRLAAADHVGQIIVDGRLEAPTGYFNASAALFTICALVATALASRRELPGLLRGILIAVASAGLELALIAQSRGWLFTLPLVLIVTFVVVPDRPRFGVTAILPTAAALIPVHRLTGVFNSSDPSALNHAAQSAGRVSLVLCTVMLVVGTVLAWTEGLVRPRELSRSRRRQLSTFATVLALAAGVAGVSAATHGDPIGFVKTQWDGFSHPTTANPTGSHFATVGSGRYDFWRVALDAVLAHPIGGLGQDNFADYYVKHRRIGEEPSWTHSLEMRLLAHTGFAGFALFVGFLVAAMTLALRGRRRWGSLARGVGGTALLPLVVWLIHGSVDWFWEIPALSGPALGFLGMAGALGAHANGVSATATPDDAAPAAGPGRARSRSRVLARPLGMLAGAIGLLAAVVVLGFSYLSVREVSLASDVRFSDPAGALRDLTRAASLDPLSADPGRLAGTIALQNGEYTVAQQRFRQSISREPGGWFAWLGAGLAASALSENARARRDYKVADSINSLQPAIRQALARVSSSHPLTSPEAFKLLVLAN
jgi:O-Antigen ligase